MLFILALVSSIVALVKLFDIVSATGINCEGNSNCIGNDHTLLNDLTNIIDDYVDSSRYYSNGEQIVCEPKTGICAFCQNSNGAPGSSIKTLINELLQHV